MRIARRYLVSGRVQGVGFRYFTHDVAVREQVHGWVRNLASGRVEIEAEAVAQALARFEAKIRQGPRGAEVDEVDVTERTATGLDSGFHIR